MNFQDNISDVWKNAGSFECDNEKLNQIFNKLNSGENVATYHDIIIATYWHYMVHGDKDIISQNYNAAKDYLLELQDKSSDVDNIDTAYFYAGVLLLSSFAEILGLGEEQTELIAMAETVKESYNAKLLVKHPTEDFFCYKDANSEDFMMTQADEALPLYWGLTPEDIHEEVEKAFCYLAQKDKTVVGNVEEQACIIQTMSQMGMHDIISHYVLSEECNFEKAGHIVEWIYTGLAGIELMVPGGRHVCIKPYLPDSVHWFKCSYKTILGEVALEIEEFEDSINVKINCPDAVHAMFDRTFLEMKGKRLTFKR